MINQTFPIVDNLLSSGLQLSQGLQLQLQEEMDILKSNQSEADLDIITRQKQQLINELNLFAKQLGQVLETEKLPNDRIGINAYFEKALTAGHDISQAAKKWQQIADITAKCRSLNDQNGAILNLLLRHTRQSLNILKGKPQTAHTYGPDGTAKSDLFSGTYISV